MKNISLQYMIIIGIFVFGSGLFSYGLGLRGIVYADTVDNIGQDTTGEANYSGDFIVGKIDELIGHLPAQSPDIYVGYYKDMLKILKHSLGDAAEKASLVIQIRELVGNYPYIVPATDKESLTTLLSILSDGTVNSVFGGSVYENEKNNILLRFKEPEKSGAIHLFEQFERAEGDQVERKKYLDAILELAGKERSKGFIDEVDFDSIRTNLCAIIIYYKLPSKTCGSFDNINNVEETDDSFNDSRLFSENVSFFMFLGLICIFLIFLGFLLGLVCVRYIIKKFVLIKKQQALFDDKKPLSKFPKT